VVVVVVVPASLWCGREPLHQSCVGRSRKPHGGLCPGKVHGCRNRSGRHTFEVRTPGHSLPQRSQAMDRIPVLAELPQQQKKIQDKESVRSLPRSQASTEKAEKTWAFAQSLQQGAHFSQAGKVLRLTLARPARRVLHRRARCRKGRSEVQRDFHDMPTPASVSRRRNEPRGSLASRNAQT